MISGVDQRPRLTTAFSRAEEQDDTRHCVDVIAVHGLCETSTTAWFEPGKSQNWLQQWLPADLEVARILTFDYDSSPSSFFESNGGDKVERIAQTLVQNIQTHRSLDQGERWPIVFLCHGIGGLIVKKALIYASSQTSAHVQHLYNIYVSTFALLLFGVPHHSLSRAIWLELEEDLLGKSRYPETKRSFRSNLQSFETDTLHSINGAFVPLMKQFRIFLIWEEVRTQLSDSEYFIVEHTSAAPDLPNTERMGICANHTDMIKFGDRDSGPYRTILASLKRYCREAPSIIATRWGIAEKHIAQARANEAYELTGVVYGLESHDRRPSTSGQLFIQAPVQLPRRPERDFVGRTKIATDLQLSFWRGKMNEQKIYVLYGMGGAGKTEISIRYAKENQSRYSAILSIDATDADKIKSSFAHIGKCGGLEATERSGRYWLEQADGPWLLIIDNADDPDLDLVSLFPNCDHGHILVTTRNPEFRRHNTVGCTLIGELERHEALQLLFLSAQIAGPPWKPAEEAAGEKIVQALGYLALALKAAGISIYRKICQLNDYLDYHKHYRSLYRVKTTQGGTFTEDEARTYAVFDISSRWLRSDVSSMDRDAGDLLNIVAFFHFERIPVETFLRAANCGQESTVMQPTERQSFLTSLVNIISKRLRPPRARPSFMRNGTQADLRYRMNKLLARLNSLSIIFYDESGATFSLHPLVHTWTRDRLKAGEKGLWARVALNVVTDSITLPTASDHGEQNLGFYRQLMPHLNSCLETCPFTYDDFTSTAVRVQLILAPFAQPSLLALLAEKVLDLAKCGYIYLSCGHFGKSTEYLAQACAALPHLAGPGHEKTLKAQLGLAHAYWGLGRLQEAIDIQRTVVDTRTAKDGPDNKETLSAMNQLAKSYWLNGQYTEALQLQERTVASMQRHLPTNDHSLLEAKDNLGVIYGAWHRFDDSLMVHSNVLQSRLGTADPDSDEVIGTKMYLAMALMETNSLADAQRHMTDVYDTRKSRLGKEHPWTLWALCYLAKIMVKVDRLEEAERLLIHGIAAGQRSLSDDHLGVLMGRGELARVYSRQGKLTQALEVLQDTVTRLAASRGLEHPDHIYGLWKLAQLHRRQSLASDAVDCCKLALSLSPGRLSLKHPLALLIQAELESLNSESTMG